MWIEKNEVHSFRESMNLSPIFFPISYRHAPLYDSQIGEFHHLGTPFDLMSLL
jgi:hypothetical protein